MFLFDPEIRIVWEGSWGGNIVEPRRRLYNCEFIYVSEGAYQLDIAGTCHCMRKGSIAIIPPQVWHESRTGPHGYTFRHCIHFDWLPNNPVKQRPIAGFDGEPYNTELSSPIPPYIFPFLPLVSHRESHAMVIDLVETALNHIRRKQVLGLYLFWSVLRMLLSLSSGRDVNLLLASKTARSVLTVRDYIDKHYAEPQDYATYHQLTRLSKSHLCQAFTALIGHPPLKYLSTLRLHHACRLLQEGSLNIAEVACAVGIPDPNYFSRLFRRKFGQSPSYFMAAGKRTDRNGHKVVPNADPLTDMTD